MTEYKFPCPQCGQRLAGDDSWAGRHIKCPACQADFTVPPFSAPVPPSPPPAPPPSKPPPAPAKTAAPAVAPAPQSAPKPQAPVKKTGKSKTKLIVGGILALIGVAALGFFAYSKLSGGTAAPAGPSPSGADTRQAAISPEPASGSVATDPASVEILPTPPMGTLLGQPFKAQKSRFSGGSLWITQGSGRKPEAEIWLALSLAKPDDYVGKTILITPGYEGARPKVQLSRGSSKSNAKLFTQGYVMRIEFGAPVGKKLPGKIYLEMPKSAGTVVNGMFNADLE